MIDLAEFHFIRPDWLYALFPTLIIIILLVKNKLKQGNWAQVCDTELLPFILQQKPVHRSHLTLSLGAVCSLLVIFSLAGPTWERLPSPVFRNDAALVIALDLSLSMDATDIKPSRLSRARFKIADVLKRRKEGQTALLVYAADAYTVTPLTEDTETINSQLTALTTEIMPVQGNNSLLALNKAVGLLKQSGLQTGDILFITDAVNNDEMTQAIQSFASYHISILGVGTAEGAPIKLAEGGFLKDQRGSIVVPKLDDSKLAHLAAIGNGIYRTISSDDSDIEALLQQLVEPSDNQQSKSDLLLDQWNEKGPWILLLVLPMAALQFRKGLLSVVFLLMLPFPETSYALEWDDLWQSKNQKAQQAFTDENYQQSAEQFDDVSWKAAAQYKAGQFQQAGETLSQAESATELYNKGNALAQSGQFEAAIEAYKNTLIKDPANNDAQYNKELVEKELEKQKKKQDQEKEQQNKEDDQQSEQDKSQEKSDQGDSSEPSDERSKNDEQDSESDSDQSNEQQNTDKKEEEAKDGQQEEDEKKQQQQAESEEAEEKQTEENSEYNEVEQANEQWLKRIPDDPAGLLKRKFKYQYGQRGRKFTSQQNW